MIVSVGDKKKETELGDWSKEKGQWCFREVITMEVNPTEELSVVVDSSKRYNLYVASVSVQNHKVGELCFPVASVLNRLRAEDRDTEGLIYATPVISFDITQEGKVTGKIYLSFETKSPPQSLKKGDVDRCCGLAPDTLYREYRSGEDDSTTAGTASDIGSDVIFPRFHSRESEDTGRCRTAVRGGG
jgi:hypothetical protein